MTDQELDKMMRRVLSDAIELDCAGCGGQSVSFEPSRRHRQQMQSMLHNPLHWVRKKTRPLWKQALQRIAVILLVVSVGFGFVMALSPTAWAAVSRWFVEWYETHLVYRYAGEDISGDMPHYDITGLPAGYRETERYEDSLWVNVVYENSDGDKIYFDYSLIQQGGANAFVTDGDAILDVSIHAFDGRLFIPQDPASRKTITWIDPVNHIQFDIIAALDDAEMIRMAESISVKEKTK